MVKEKLLSIVTDLLQAVEKNKHRFSSIGVSNGQSGLALLYISLYQSTRESTYAEKAKEVIFNSIEQLNEGYSSRTVFREIAEIGIMLELSKKVELISDDLETLLSDFDEILLNEMQDQIANYNYDPVTGAMAQGAYFLLRSDSPVAKKALGFLDDFIVQSAIWEDGMAHWTSRLKEKDTIYLGLSHGSAALINYLVSRLQHQSSAHDMGRLIKGATDYILSKQLKEGPVFFPVEVGERYKDDQIYSNNICYGDPGTLYGLFKGLQYSQHSDSIEQVSQMIHLAAQRELKLPYLSSGYSLLYGKAGLYSLYSKLSVKLHSQKLSESAELILTDLIDAYNPNDEFLGYRGYWNQQIDTTNFSFSEGMMGIAITLLASTDPAIHDYTSAFFSLN